ncbi:endonuclease/Exonuclease/phosphatase family protein [Mycobacterium xenopi 4042]|uniref:Endonuclease/Exonuclease/phosphatase family protein n=1 Tax=Mycobacterium xenopi 4042 TaxID=1299334 RepID=X7YJM6_MYCXE|nr:endonuclease/Exonuclease/phosphatase family protein [Mycobacterium xenopi 4042]
MAANGREQPGTAGYGIALLSRFPALTWQVLRLPRILARFPMYLPGPRRVRIVNEEPRAAVIARLDTDLGPLTVANTHLSFVPGWNRVQLRRLVRDLRGFPGPGADGRPEHRSARAGPPDRVAAARHGATFPADNPDRQLDHILTDDARLQAHACAAPGWRSRITGR